MTWESGGTRQVSPEFRRNRPLVLERDKRICQLTWRGCINVATEVDHKRNFARGGKDSMDNLQAVCVECHKRKTAVEARASREKAKRDAKHPDSLRKHPGYL